MKTLGKIIGYANKITPISLTICPNYISNQSHESGLLLNGQICRLFNLHIH